MSPRQDPLVLALTDQVLVYGGFTFDEGADLPVLPLGDGAVLDVGSGDWRALPSAPFEQPLLYTTGVWTGEEAVIRGTPCAAATDEIYEPQCEPGGVEAAAYSPAAGTWRLIEGMGIESGAAVDGVGVGWTGTEAVFEVSGAVAEEVLLVDPARGSSRLAREPAGVDAVCVTGSSVVAVRTGQVLPEGGRLSPNPVAAAEPLRTFSLDTRSLGWTELPATPKPASVGAMFENVSCSAGALAYWPTLPAPIGVDVGGLWWDSARRRWEPLPGLGGELPGAGRVAALGGWRVLWMSGAERLFVLPPGGTAWSSLAAPTRRPVRLGSLAEVLLVIPSTKRGDRLRIGLLDPERYVAAAG